MVIEVLRNMFRRKFRTLLTVFGIAIGIFAFTVMGSMALKFNKMIDGGKRYITGQISISPKGGDFMSGSTGALPLDTLNKIAKVEGVEAVEGSVSLSLDEPDLDNPSMSMGVPATIYSVDSDSGFVNKNWSTLDMKEGKMIDKTTAVDEITIGSSISLDKKWKVGDMAKIRGREFKVVGILDKTMTGPDSYVFMHLDAASELYIEANPFLKSLRDRSADASKISDAELGKLSPDAREQIVQAKAFSASDVSNSASVSWRDGQDPEEVVARIKDQYGKDVVVLSPKKMGEQIDKASVTFNAVILGAALLALIVGGFSIINTMIMSISERTREIGIKKAIGASDNAIAKEYTLEAGLIGLLGGMVGAAFGLLMIMGVNGKMAEKGAEIFLLDWNFMAGVLIFSFSLGILAGLIPAVRASKMKPVQALRAE